MERVPDIGEAKTFVPQAFEAGLPTGTPKQVTGKVIWIHPELRYYVVHVDNAAGGWNETFYIE